MCAPFCSHAHALWQAGACSLGGSAAAAGCALTCTHMQHAIQIHAWGYSHGLQVCRVVARAASSSSTEGGQQPTQRQAAAGAASFSLPCQTHQAMAVTSCSSASPHPARLPILLPPPLRPGRPPPTLRLLDTPFAAVRHGVPRHGTARQETARATSHA